MTRLVLLHGKKLLLSMVARFLGTGSGVDDDLRPLTHITNKKAQNHP